MYKQCFELLTAQGPKPHRSFSVSNSLQEVHKEFDQEVKGNVFLLGGQRIQLPPNPQSLQADFHNGGAATKKMSVSASLNVVHQFLVFQVFIGQNDSFSLEIHVRDKGNQRRRLMFCDGTKSIVNNQMHARIPNGMVVRERWVNLCLDVNSFIKECFSKNTVHGTPQIQTNVQAMAVTKMTGAGSGDMAVLHSAKNAETNQIAFGKGAIDKSNSQNPHQNNMKTIEMIQMEGTFKIRKIFTSRSCISQENAFEVAYTNSADTGFQRQEQIPKNFDFVPQVEKVNQVLSYDSVNGFVEQKMSSIDQIEDSMMVTGMKLTTNTYVGKHDQANTTQSSGMRATSGGRQGLQGLTGTGMKPSRSNYKLGFRGASNERKSSINGDGSQLGEGLSPGLAPYPRIKPPQLFKQDSENRGGQAFRNGNNQSQITQQSVVVVDQEEQLQMQNGSELRNSAIGVMSGVKQANMKINCGLSNITSDTIFKQANSTTSNNGKSQATVSTAYSVRTASSGAQKGKLGNLQTSQSPFTEANAGNGQYSFKSRKRSQHASQNRGGCETVDENEEGQISLQLGGKSAVINTGAKKPQRAPRVTSPDQTSQNAQSAKVTRKGGIGTRQGIETAFQHTVEKSHNHKIRDPMTTPKLHQMQEVHQTTILEENENMRASIDKYPGSRQGLNFQGTNLASNQKKYSMLEQKKLGNSAQIRKGHANKQLRTKSSVSGAVMTNHADVTPTSNTASSTTHPLQKQKMQNPKQHYSSSNLEDSIGGVIGNSINKTNKQGTYAQVNSRMNAKVVSPNVRQRHQAQAQTKNQLSAQKKSRKSTYNEHQSQGGKSGPARQNPAHFLYGTGYTSNSIQGNANQYHNQAGDSEEEQSDFKTTTLRFTNNNFVEERKAPRDRSQNAGGERDSSYGAIGGQLQTNTSVLGGGQASLLTTMNSNQNLRHNNGSQNVNKFGTSDNFQTGSYQITNTNPKRHHQRQRDPEAYDNRTDGFNQHNKNHHILRGNSPTPNQFISEPSHQVENQEEEEQIEEEICLSHNDSPLINAKTKQMNGKAKALAPSQQPPIFQSTESGRFKLDTMTGFNQSRQTNHLGMNMTPSQDKQNLLGIKPFIGGKMQNGKSPDRQVASLFNSMQNIEGDNHVYHTEREIQEEIGVLEDTVETHNQRLNEIDPSDTQTSEFYQIPITGGLPIKLNIDNSRRPFTPPFAQLSKMNNQKPDSKQSSQRGQKSQNKPTPSFLPNRAPPEWVSPATKSIFIPYDNKSNNVDILVLDDHAETIEEEIENEIGACSPPPNKKSDKVPTQAADSTTTNSNQNKKQSISEPDAIPFTASMTRKTESDQYDTGHFSPETSKDHTFGRRSKQSNKDESKTGGLDDSEEELDRAEIAVNHHNINLLDHVTAQNNKKLLYDKSLKAYYDPETAQYFELKEAQLKPSASQTEIALLAQNEEKKQ